MTKKSKNKNKSVIKKTSAKIVNLITNKKTAPIVFIVVFGLIGGSIYLYKSSASCSNCSNYNYKYVAYSAGWSSIRACNLGNNSASVKFTNNNYSYGADVFSNGIRLIYRMPGGHSYTGTFWNGSNTKMTHYYSGRAKSIYYTVKVGSLPRC